MDKPKFPDVGSKSVLDEASKKLLQDNPGIGLGRRDFLAERSQHAKFFGIHNIPTAMQAPIERIEFTAIRGPVGTTHVHILYPSSTRQARKQHQAPALVYFHGGGFTVGAVDEVENALRIIAEEAAIVIIAVEYHLSPEWKYPTQIDEYAEVVSWVQGEAGYLRGIDPSRICGGGDCVGGTMTSSIALRFRDTNPSQQLKAQILLYPQPKLPYDTVAANDNNTGCYLECNAIFSFTDHYLPHGIPAYQPYVFPGTQPAEELQNMPPTAVFTCGFDPLRDVGIEFARKLSEAGNEVTWNHYDDLCHGFLLFTPWSSRCKEALVDIGAVVKKLAYE